MRQIVEKTGAGVYLCLQYIGGDATLFAVIKLYALTKLPDELMKVGNCTVQRGTKYEFV